MSLLDELKLKLGKTLDEEDTHLTQIIETGKAIICDRLGDSSIDFDSVGMERSFLLNYCMYDYNNCDSDFWDAYSKEYVTLRTKYEVRNYEGDY